MKRNIIGVMGSGVESHEELSAPLGQLIAQLGCHLLTGGSSGVMEAVSRAFCQVEGRQGLCIGIIRSAQLPELNPQTGRRSYQPGGWNDWVEIPILTHLPLSGTEGTDYLSRNHINVLTADAVIALPGGAGTYSEVQLCLQYGKPLILFLDGKTIDGKTPQQIQKELGGSERIKIADSWEDVEKWTERIPFKNKG
ncbi:MAG: molybdenum cofactor carrier protein [bacterium]